jgi:hypothetical protein
VLVYRPDVLGWRGGQGQNGWRFRHRHAAGWRGGRNIPVISNNGPRRDTSTICATLREGNVARKRRLHETLRGRSRIDFPIRLH